MKITFRFFYNFVGNIINLYMINMINLVERIIGVRELYAITRILFSIQNMDKGNDTSFSRLLLLLFFSYYYC